MLSLKCSHTVYLQNNSYVTVVKTTQYHKPARHDHDPTRVNFLIQISFPTKTSLLGLFCHQRDRATFGLGTNAAARPHPVKPGLGRVSAHLQNQFSKFALSTLISSKFLIFFIQDPNQMVFNSINSLHTELHIYRTISTLQEFYPTI